MEEQIPLLIELSQADLKHHRLRERYEVIPKEIETHESALRLHSNALADHEQRYEDLQRERRALERESDQAKARRREVELQQFRVKNNTEYQAFTKEIEEMRRRSSEFEEQGLAILAQEEEAQAEIQRLKEMIEQEKQRVAQTRERLEAERATLHDALQLTGQARATLVERLQPRVRVRYERILKSKGDMAVVAVANGACGGCFYQLPPQKLTEVKKGHTLILCEGCGRIQVWPDGS